MQLLGRGTAAFLAVFSLGAVVIGMRSIPDMKRYLRIRQM